MNRFVLVLLLTAVATGCGGAKLTWEEQLDSPAGVERTQGVMTVGERNIQPAIPRLIELLNDRDVSVRVVTARTLRNMTGQNFGYVAYADDTEREAAARRWQAWWDGQHGAAPETKTPQTPEAPETPEAGGKT